MNSIREDIIAFLLSTKMSLPCGYLSVPLIEMPEASVVQRLTKTPGHLILMVLYLSFDFEDVYVWETWG